MFEVLKRTEYIYQGVVELCGDPYQEKQKDEDGLLREVWMFPLKMVSGISTVTSEAYDAYVKEQEKRAKQLSVTDLKAKAQERSAAKTAHRSVIKDVDIRDPYIAEYTKVRANGICQLCNLPAPFATKDGNPYLESHHVVWLSEGGADSIDNTVALCPNCHKKMHVLNDRADVERLKNI